MKNLLLAATGCLMLASSSAQQDELLVSFTGQQVETSIQLAFTVRGGVTCLGTQVERSVDSMRYEVIGIIPGVCGSTVSDETYFFEDTAPEPNMFNYYRINFGNLGTSAPIKIKFTDYGNDFVVLPNPSGDIITVGFSNYGSELLRFSLFDLNGILLLDTETRQSTLTIQAADLASGIYLLHVRRMNETLRTVKVFID
jgi:hypothetical protein